MIEFAPDGPLLAFGGPYSNLAALRAVRAEAEKLGIATDRVICTGDVVAYCAEPEETVALMREWGVRTIAGNCEEQLAAGADDCGCGFEEGSECERLAKGWYPFAAARISEASRRWMASLSPNIRFRLAGFTFIVVHGGIAQTSKFLFASERDKLQSEMAQVEADIVIAGHCGLPFIAKLGRRAWLNPGVIGMPANDGQPAVWYALIKPTAGGLKLELRRLDYDHAAAAAGMRRHGHANDYARTLITGLWPSLDILPVTEKAVTGRRIRPQTVTLKAATPASV